MKLSHWKTLLSPAVFGVFDGSTSSVGVLLTSLHMTGHAILIVCFGLAVAGGVGMMAGSWLSEDRSGGLVQAAAIGTATLIGTMLPALPYAWSSGNSALVGSSVILFLIGALITVVRSRTASVLRAAAETYGVLTAVCVAVGVCALVTGGAG